MTSPITVPTTGSLLVGLLAAVGGGLAGFATRALTARLRRGAELPVVAVAGGTAATCGVVAALLWPLPLVWPALWLALLTPVLTGTDLRHHRLPDALTLPGLIGVLVLCAAVAPATAARSADVVDGEALLLRVLLAVVVVGGLFALPALLTRSGMGWGDVKLVGIPVAVAALVGWRTVVTVLLIAFVLAGVVAAGGLVTGRLRRGAALAFGPFLLVGGLLAVVLDASPLWSGGAA